MIFVLRLHTLPGQNVAGTADTYVISESRGEFTLASHQLAPRSFPSLERLAWSLGGIVPWERWSEDAQRQIAHLGLRSAF